MRTSKEGIDLICKFEGCRLTAYQCSAGVWTIGFGHTGLVDGKPICEGMKITKAKAEKLLYEDDIKRFENQVNKYMSIYSFTQNQFDALVSFAFNIGSIKQLTQDGTRTKAQIGVAIILYNKASGKVLKGLDRRRKEEQALYFRKPLVD